MHRRNRAPLGGRIDDRVGEATWQAGMASEEKREPERRNDRNHRRMEWGEEASPERGEGAGLTPKKRDEIIPSPSNSPVGVGSGGTFFRWPETSPGERFVATAAERRLRTFVLGSVGSGSPSGSISLFIRIPFPCPSRAALPSFLPLAWVRVFRAAYQNSTFPWPAARCFGTRCNPCAGHPRSRMFLLSSAMAMAISMH